MTNAMTVYRAKQAKRTSARRNARRIRQLGEWAGAGLALVAVCVLLLAVLGVYTQGPMPYDRDAADYALVVDGNGQAYVMDYAMTISDCVGEALRYDASANAHCELAKVAMR